MITEVATPVADCIAAGRWRTWAIAAVLIAASGACTVVPVSLPLVTSDAAAIADGPLCPVVSTARRRPGEACQCDSECAGNACVRGLCCEGTSCPKLPAGAECARDDDCAAPGSCAQGRCCTTPCYGVCQSCALAGSLGTCTPVPANGPDPTATCKYEECSNGCDGKGGCQRTATGASCGVSACTAAGALQTFTCSAQGKCETRSTTCVPGTNCQNDACVRVPQELGGSCAGNEACKSGACVAGHCCDQACPGRCKVCEAASDWKCSPIKCDTGSSCNSSTGQCDALVRGPGEGCGDNNGSCASGLGCVAGLCCTALACGGACVTGNCRVDGAGCEPKADGTDCGTACADGTTLATMICRAGACAAGSQACPGGQICSGGQCQPQAPQPDGGGGIDCAAGCDNECMIIDLLGTCAPRPDGTSCHGNRTCQKCVCVK